MKTAEERASMRQQNLGEARKRGADVSLTCGDTEIEPPPCILLCDSLSVIIPCLLGKIMI